MLNNSLTQLQLVVKLHVQIHLCFYSSQSVSCDVLFLSMDRVAKCLGACDLSEHHSPVIYVLSHVILWQLVEDSKRAKAIVS